MKIKAVCELTGLSDRTIRYYIEQDLISPAYTESYLGRKCFDFSQKDIKELNDIAVLRKYDFTIEEIREIINDPEKSKTIIRNAKGRAEQSLCETEEKLSVLSQISTDNIYTLAELAEELSKSCSEPAIKNEVVKRSTFKSILAAIKAIVVFVIVWMPVAVSIFAVVISIYDYHYPVFEPVCIALTIVFFLPSIAVLIVSKTKLSRKKSAKRILLILCVLSIPVSFFMSFGIVTKSETTDFHNYLKFDVGCWANRVIIVQELFPDSPHYFEIIEQPDGKYETVPTDAAYYYSFYQNLDDACDICAEWSLEEDDFGEELKRASAIFQEAVENGIHDYKFTEIEKGNFKCLVLYSGSEPFHKATGDYTYILFAYDETDKTVRYIYCSSFANGAAQPYYLQLGW